MNWTCVVRDCQCYVNVPKIKQEAKDLKKIVKNTTLEVLDYASKNYATKVNEAYRTYRIKEAAIINQIGQDIKNEIIAVVPESQDCFAYCNKYYSFNIKKFVKCVGRCVDNYDYYNQNGYFNSTNNWNTNIKTH